MPFRQRPAEYNCWAMMIQRCTNPRATSYASYGGRGISVHPSWRRFKVFIADVGPRPTPEHELERIDNDRDYEPGNVRWARHVEQMNNTRLTTRLTFMGATRSLHEWANEKGLNPVTIRTRLKRGWSVHRALTTPGRR